MSRLILNARLAMALLRTLAAGIVLGVAGQAAALDRSFEARAEARFKQPEYGVGNWVVSNVVATDILEQTAAIAYFTDGGFNREAAAGALNQQLFVQATAPGCDHGDQIEVVSIRLFSETLQTSVTVTATETSPMSGVFRSSADLKAIDGTITTSNDTLWAILEGCGPSIKTPLSMDPSAMVFDSHTQQPLAGVSVTLIDVNGLSNGGVAGAAAHVLSSDGVTLAANPVLTDAQGRYSFPWIKPGSYRLEVKTDEGWTFPSQVLPDKLTNRKVLALTSYGKAFNVEKGSAAALPDVPVDPLPGAMRVQLNVSRDTAEIAESVVYTATLRNVGDTALRGVTLAGGLPAGFAYVPGSARREGKPIADPTGGRGPALRFVLDRIDAGGGTAVTYRVLIRSNALQGDGVHRIQARADLPAATLSNLASAKVEVQAGVFSDKGMVLGTVFADCNGNGLQDDGERGVPGVRLVLQNGSFAVTDAQGRYSLYGLRPRTHVLKIDAASLPDGAQAMATSRRHAGDGHSRFVDLRRSELQRADFALAGCSSALTEQLRQRGARQQASRELLSATHTELTPDGSARALGDRRTAQASGLIGESNNALKTAPGAEAAKAAEAAAALAAAQAGAATVAPEDRDTALEALATQLEAKLGFVDLQDGQTVSGQPLLLRTQGRASALITLDVNGEVVGDERIGQRVQVPQSQAELREYVGVRMRPGRNTLTLTERDDFGNTRAQHSVQVVAPGALAQFRIGLPAAALASDSDTVTPVTIELLDAAGQRIGGRIPVTLDTTLGLWEVHDLEPATPGVQTFIEDGLANLGLRSPSQPGHAEIKLSSGSVTTQAKVNFEPALRPLMAVGLIEGVFNLRRLKASDVKAADATDGFDAELLRQGQQGTASDGNGNSNGKSARAALYLKGKVRGDTLLTLGYESDKDRRERLFRDIQPDAFYPIYGDASVKGYDAQSTSRLYVRLDRGATSLLYGDFSTQTTNPLRQLGAYQRSLTGARLTHGGDTLNGSAFAAYDSSRQQVIEQGGNGTSGPYDLASTQVLANSEKVEILVRDRNRPAVVLRSTAQARFADYDFEPLTGRLLMRAPVPSVDADLNPVSIRVTAEVEQGGPKFWVVGADGQLRLSERIEVGGSVVKDSNPLQPFQLSSANLSVKLGEHTTLNAETARTERGSELGSISPMTPTGTGVAQRVELQHEGAAFKAKVFAARSDGAFSNPSASLSPGRSEAGLKADYRLDERSRLLAEGLHSQDRNTGAARDGVLLGYERSIDGGIKAEIGLRHVLGAPDGAAAGGARQAASTLRGKIASVLPWAPMASAFLEAEQDLANTNKHMLAVGGDLQLAGAGRLYVRHEVISSLTGPYALDATQRRNSTLLGIDSAAPLDGRTFGEYRVRDGLSGREAEAAMGLRNQWTVGPGLRLNTSFERVQTLQGSTDGQTAAATASLEYTRSADFKASTRLELRRNSSTSSLLATAAGAWKLGDDWTALARGVENVVRSSKGQPDHEQQRVQLGVAYRDSSTNRVNGLARYEFKRETGIANAVGGSDAVAGARSAHIVSTHADWQVRADTMLTGQLAMKQVRETMDGQPVRSAAQLIAARFTRDIGQRWDAGVSASVLLSPGSRQHSVGAEVGYRMQNNLWLSLGFNASGFNDRDLGTDKHTERGVYLQLRFKFDERSLGLS